MTRGGDLRSSYMRAAPRRGIALTGVVVAVIAALALVIAVSIATVPDNPSPSGWKPQSVILAVPSTTRNATPNATPNAPIHEVSGVFVTTTGGRFIYQGTPLRLSGYTFYPAVAGGTAAWRRTTFQAYIDHILSMGAMAGQNLARPTDFWDSTNTSQTWNDPIIWSNMDHLVQAAHQRGIFVLMDLSAFKWLLVSQGKDPYDANNWIAYLDFVGARYRDEPAIAFYSIVGEPPAPTTPSASDQLVAFYRTLTDELRRADQGHHLIAAGGFNHMENETPSTPWWHQIYALPGNDVVAFKTYSQHDLNLMPTITAYAQQLGKPLVDEEFGMPQYMGDDTYTGGSSGYNGLYTSRAAFYHNVYAIGLSHGVTAFVFWNLGCQLGNQSYEVSPSTPAVWQVIAANGPGPTVPWSGNSPPC